jgi:hypothetical protein
MLPSSDAKDGRTVRATTAAILASCTGPGDAPVHADAPSSPPGATTPVCDVADTHVPGWERLELALPPLAWLAVDGGSAVAVDSDGSVVERRGSVWTGPVGTLDRVGAVGAGNGTSWAAACRGIARFDGEQWVLEAERPGGWFEKAVVPRADGTVAVLSSAAITVPGRGATPGNGINTLLSWDGSTLSEFSASADYLLMDMVETSEGRLIAVGNGGEVVEWTGTSWEMLRRGRGTLHALAADGVGRIAAGGQAGGVGVILLGPPDALVTTRPGHRIDDLAFAEDGTLWALHDDTAWFGDGATMSPVSIADGGRAIGAYGATVFVAGSASGPTIQEITAEGSGTVWHRPSVTGGGGLWVDPEGVAWLGGSAGEVARWDSTDLTVWQLGGIYAVEAMAGRTATDVVAGARGAMWGWDGSTWTQVWEGTADVNAIALAPDGSGFAVGNEVEVPQTPVFLVGTDAGWQSGPIPADVVPAVVGFSAGEAYAVGCSDRCELWRWDGAEWTAIGPRLPLGYTALWGRSGTDLYVGHPSASGTHDPLLPLGRHDVRPGGGCARRSLPDHG